MNLPESYNCDFVNQGTLPECYNCPRRLDCMKLFQAELNSVHHFMYLCSCTGHLDEHRISLIRVGLTAASSVSDNPVAFHELMKLYASQYNSD